MLGEYSVDSSYLPLQRIEDRHMAELQGKSSQKTYELFSGVRCAKDTFTDGQVGQSDQFFVGAHDRLADRLLVSIGVISRSATTTATPILRVRA